MVCDQHLPLSGAPLSKFAVLGGPVNNDNGSWADTPIPQGSALHLLRRYKSIQCEYFPDLEGNFSRIITLYIHLQVCVCASVNKLKQMYYECCSLRLLSNLDL